MKKIIISLAIIALLYTPLAFTAEKLNLNELILSLPQEWETSITSNIGGIIGVDKNPIFAIFFELKTKEYRVEIRHDEFHNTHPSFVLTFFKRFTKKDWDIYKKAKKDLEINSERAYSMPSLFVETDEFSIFYYPAHQEEKKKVQSIIKNYFENQ